MISFSATESYASGIPEGIHVRIDKMEKPRSGIAEEGLSKLNHESSVKWRVQWDNTRGLPKVLDGTVHVETSKGFEEAAIKFVEDHLDLLMGIQDKEEIADYSFSVGRVLEDRSRKSVQVQCYYKGIIVYKGVTTLIFSSSGRIEHIQNYLRPVSIENVTPSLSANSADQVIADAAAPDTVHAGGGEFELIIYPSKPARLAYTGFRTINKTPWRITLDANSGEFLHSQICGITDDWSHTGGAGDRPVISDSLCKQPPLSDSVGRVHPLKRPLGDTLNIRSKDLPD